MHEGHDDQTLMLWPWRHGSFCWLLGAVGAQLGTRRPSMGSAESGEMGKRNGGKAPTDAPKTVCLKGGGQDRVALARGGTFTVVGISLFLQGQG